MDKIKHWEVIELYSRACKNEFWIEALHLGYLMIIESLIFSLKSKHSSGPLSDEEISKTRNYLILLARKAVDEKFITEDLFIKIKNFNNVRRNVAHHLTKGLLNYEEIEEAVKNIGPIKSELQSICLLIKTGEPQSP